MSGQFVTQKSGVLGQPRLGAIISFCTSIAVFPVIGTRVPCEPITRYGAPMFIKLSAEPNTTSPPATNLMELGVGSFTITTSLSVRTPYEQLSLMEGRTLQEASSEGGKTVTTGSVQNMPGFLINTSVLPPLESKENLIRTEAFLIPEMVVLNSVGLRHLAWVNTMISFKLFDKELGPKGARKRPLTDE